ncbi:OB-fold nucleic acid binding domain-containing protein [Candidatus Pacearchaeota archaeon]|nr:OB-fold nucleic acid binding domain-containing protein [Candidatus Pacearchaeota archaeon]
MPDEQFKRNIAYKLRISDLTNGNPILEGERFSFLDLNGKKIIRVNVIGSIVDKYSSEGEKRFLFLTLDDGSGQVKLKSFGDDSTRFSWISQGQIVAVIGVLRFFNNEVYISPEIVRELDSKYLLVRRLELEKNKKSVPEKKEGVPFSVKEKIIDLIKNAEINGGIDLEKLIFDLNGNPPELINSEIQKLLEEGVVFEPRPGRIRWLG